MHFCVTESHCNETKRQSRCLTSRFAVERSNVNAVGWGRELFLTIEGTNGGFLTSHIAVFLPSPFQ